VLFLSILEQTGTVIVATLFEVWLNAQTAWMTVLQPDLLRVD